MKYSPYQIISFKEGEYLVLDVVNYNENTFLYLINNNEFEDDISLVKVLEDGSFGQIDDEKEFDYVINKIFLDNEEDLSQFS
jgi:hypothetical protein